jgi:hypothetical protein
MSIDQDPFEYDNTYVCNGIYLAGAREQWQVVEERLHLILARAGRILSTLWSTYHAWSCYFRVHDWTRYFHFKHLLLIRKIDALHTGYRYLFWPEVWYEVSVKTWPEPVPRKCPGKGSIGTKWLIIRYKVSRNWLKNRYWVFWSWYIVGLWPSTRRTGDKLPAMTRTKFLDRLLVNKLVPTRCLGV